MSFNAAVIDVSVYQGSIDWQRVKAAGIYAAVLRAGYGRYAKQEDLRFAENYTNARAAGLPVGAYWFSYAKTPEEAVLEAQVCLQVLAGRALQMPLYFDQEETSIPAASRTACAVAFLDYIRANSPYLAGYYTYTAYFASVDIPTIRNKNTTVFTNHAWGSAFRAYGSPQSFMGSEIAIDVLAAKMGMDPFDIRELNCYKESEHSTIPTGYAPDVYCLEGMYKVARPLYEAAKKRVAEKNAASDGRYKYGIGVSSGVYGCGLDGVDSSQAYAELNPDGTVTIYVSWEDHGQGADMGALVSAHETLRQAGIRPDQIRLVMNDTKITPNSGPAGGSRSQVMSGNACRLAAENLLAAMKKEDGTYRTYDEMKAEGIETKVQGQWVTTYCAEHPIDQATAQGEPFATYMYTLFLPEVCVDTQTGKVTVEKFTCVADVGTIMNKLLVDGNFYGGLAQGIGLALSEDFDDLSKHTSLKNCGIPYPKDIPDDIELHYTQTYRPNGPYGAAGCGEAPLDAPHPAILNAIFNATGARITRVPALPEVVLAALQELKN